MQIDRILISFNALGYLDKKAPSSIFMIISSHSLLSGKISLV